MTTIPTGSISIDDLAKHDAMNDATRAAYDVALTNAAAMSGQYASAAIGSDETAFGHPCARFFGSPRRLKYPRY